MHSLVLKVQIDIVEDFLRRQVHSLHGMALEYELRRLADKELAHSHELLFCERLPSVVHLAWSVPKARDLEQFLIVLHIRGTVKALLIKFHHVEGRLSLLPQRLVVEDGARCGCRIITTMLEGLEYGHPFPCFAIVTLH